VKSLKKDKKMEIMFHRRKPFVWIYFNIGKYIYCRRVAFDFYIQIRNKVKGFSIAWEEK